MTDDNRLAVLIDADNTPARVVKDLFEELAGYGTITGQARANVSHVTNRVSPAPRRAKA